jgi:hypothetical protein
MTIIVHPCLMQGNQVYRQLAGEVPQYFGAYRQHQNGTESHLLDMILLDAGKKAPNEQYTAVFGKPSRSRAYGNTTFPYIAMNSLGMFYHGEIDESYLKALSMGDASLPDKVTHWDRLPMPVKHAVLQELRSIADFH